MFDVEVLLQLNGVKCNYWVSYGILGMMICGDFKEFF